MPPPDTPELSSPAREEVFVSYPLLAPPRAAVTIRSPQRKRPAIRVEFGDERYLYVFRSEIGEYVRKTLCIFRIADGLVDTLDGLMSTMST